MLDAKTAVTALILALALGAAATASARDAVAQPKTPAVPRRVDIAQTQGCGVDGRSPCAEHAAKRRKARVETESAGRLSRFAKLAGTFMGRVDVADAGDFRLRFKLELR